MKLQHLDCTTDARREQICKEYDVHADDCIVLFGGRTVRSDANNRIIRDKYYQFSCKDKQTGKEMFVITCGSGAAYHFCSLINEPLPPSMNPFIQDGPEKKSQHIEADTGTEWNPLRRQFYYAVQLFIMRYQDNLTPGTKIFNILNSITDEKFISCKPQRFHFESFSEVVIGFHTNMSQVISYLRRFGPLHKYDFSNLAKEHDLLCPDSPNVFLEDV